MVLAEQIRPPRSNGSICGWKALVARLHAEGHDDEVETLEGWLEDARAGDGRRFNQISYALAKEAKESNRPWMSLGESTVRRHGRRACTTCQQ